MMRLRSWLISAWKANVSVSAIADLREGERTNEEERKEEQNEER